MNNSSNKRYHCCGTQLKRLYLILFLNTCALTFTLTNKDMGVIIIPKKLPKMELKIAAVSFPCAALVRITALETGGGIHATVINLKHKVDNGKLIFSQ